MRIQGLLQIAGDLCQPLSQLIQGDGAIAICVLQASPDESHLQPLIAVRFCWPPDSAGFRYSKGKLAHAYLPMQPSTAV